MTREKKEKEKLSELPPPFSFSFTYEIFPSARERKNKNNDGNIILLLLLLLLLCGRYNRSADEMDLLDNRAPNAELSSAPLAVDTPLPPTTIKLVFNSIEICLYLQLNF
jgi:hypothetical protein